MKMNITYCDLQPLARGTYRRLKFKLFSQVPGSAPVPMTLDGVLLRFVLVKSNGDDNANAVIDKTASEQLSDYEAAIDILESDTSVLDAANYYFRLYATISGKTIRVVKGILPIEM